MFDQFLDIDYPDNPQPPIDEPEYRNSKGDEFDDDINDLHLGFHGFLRSISSSVRVLDRLEQRKTVTKTMGVSN